MDRWNRVICIHTYMQTYLRNNKTNAPIEARNCNFPPFQVLIDRPTEIPTDQPITTNQQTDMRVYRGTYISNKYNDLFKTP